MKKEIKKNTKVIKVKKIRKAAYDLARQLGITVVFV